MSTDGTIEMTYGSCIDLELRGSLDLIVTRIAESDGRQADRYVSLEKGISELRSEVKSDYRHTRSTVRNSAFALAGLIIAAMAVIVTLVALSQLVLV